MRIIVPDSFVKSRVVQRPEIILTSVELKYKPTPLFGKPGKLPDLIVPKSMLLDFAATVHRQLANTGHFFRRGGSIVKIGKDGAGRAILEDIDPMTFRMEIERHFTITRETKTGKKVPSILTMDQASAVLAYKGESSIPEIQRIVDCPIIDQDGLIRKRGFHPDIANGTFVSDGEAHTAMSLNRAVELVELLLVDYDFVTPSDRTRAIAAILSPALFQGGHLFGRGIVHVLEADSSQTGKGYFVDLICAIYNNIPEYVRQKGQGGVGGQQESFEHAVSTGRPFINFDNFRGKLDSPAIESSLTAQEIDVRLPHRGYAKVKLDGISYFLTSNGAEMTTDFSKRSSIIRMKKNGDDHQFERFPEGDLLDHVRANKATFLGAVLRVVQTWIIDGSPQTDETRHDFRKWARSLDFITGTYFKSHRLMDGHQSLQQRVANPFMNSLRELAIIAKRDEDYTFRSPSFFIKWASDKGVELPLAKGDDDSKNKSFGRKVGPLFDKAGTSKIEIDDMNFERGGAYFDGKHDSKQYRFIPIDHSNPADA
jgi:hypothetical protein